MSLSKSRERLAHAQAGLVDSLVGAGKRPGDFDQARLAAAARALASKRSRAVAKAWPLLAQTLGNAFAGLFRAYANEHVVPESGGAIADGRRFAHFLAISGQLPEPGQVQALLVDLQFRSLGNGLERRRGVSVKAVLLTQSDRLMIGLHLPWLGVRYFFVPTRLTG